MTAAPMSPSLSQRRAGKRDLGPFSATLVLWLVVIGVLAFIASMVVAAFASDWQSGDNGAGHALSRSAIGFAGAVELLRQTGTEVEISRTDYPGDEQSSLLVLTPPQDARPEALDEIEFDGPRMAVLPKWAPAPFRQGWVRGRKMLDPDKTLESVNGEKGKTELQIHPGAARRTLVKADGQPFAVTGPIEGFRTVSGGGWTPVVVDAKGGIVLGRNKGRWILSDPDLLNTQGLTELATARAGLGLLDLAREGDGPVIFDVSLNGIKSQRNLLQLAFTPPFLGVTLALGLAALLLALQAMARFGPPIEQDRTFALGKQGLVDNSAALIRLARREHRMVERYALYVRGEAARAVGAPHSIAEVDLEALLDRMSVQQGLSAFTELRRQAAAAPDLGAALIAARRLYSWRLEMTRERR